MKIVTGTAALIGLIVLGGAPASANGSVFFGAMNSDLITGTVYVGTVLDNRGQPVADARVTIYLASQNLEYVIRTGADGRYWNASIRRDLDPNLVEVSVVKEGYEFVRAVPRSTTLRPGLPREINFVLAPA